PRAAATTGICRQRFSTLRAAMAHWAASRRPRYFRRLRRCLSRPAWRSSAVGWPWWLVGLGRARSSIPKYQALEGQGTRGAHPRVFSCFLQLGPGALSELYEEASVRKLASLQHSGPVRSARPHLEKAATRLFAFLNCAPEFFCTQLIRSNERLRSGFNPACAWSGRSHYRRRPDK